MPEPQLLCVLKHYYTVPDYDSHKAYETEHGCNAEIEPVDPQSERCPEKAEHTEHYRENRKGNLLEVEKQEEEQHRNRTDKTQQNLGDDCIVHSRKSSVFDSDSIRQPRLNIFLHKFLYSPHGLGLAPTHHHVGIDSDSLLAPYVRDGLRFPARGN